MFLADETTACSLGKCKVLFNFTPEHENELTLKEGEWWLQSRRSKTRKHCTGLIISLTGDLVDIFAKEENGWWFGALKGQKGHFPSGFVEELPVISSIQSSEGWVVIPMRSQKSLLLCLIVTLYSKTNTNLSLLLRVSVYYVPLWCFIFNFKNSLNLFFLLKAFVI